MQPVEEINGTRHSAVGITTGWGLDRPGIESREMFSSPEPNRQAPVPLNGTGLLSRRGGNDRLLCLEVNRG